MPQPLQVTQKSYGGLAKPTTKSALVALSIEQLGDSTLWGGAKNGAYRWMDETLEERATVRDARLASLEAIIAADVLKRRVESDLTLGTVGVPTQSEVLLCGTVVCEGLEGRLNQRSMLLEVSRASANCARVQL